MPIRDPELTPESIRIAMAIPSAGGMRGLKDGVGFARTPEQMAAVVAASSGEPAWPLGPVPDAPWIGAICPHDDFLYAGRSYRRALAGITAKTVIVVGTFHAWRKFEHGYGVFDTYETWFAPDGPVRVSTLIRDSANPFLKIFRSENAPFDHEHSIEPIVAWLRHRDPGVEILPVLAPSDEGTLDALVLGPQIVASMLHEQMEARGLKLGRDVAVVISADAIHYGKDFRQTRYGEGPEAYEQAVAEDLRILRTMLAGEISDGRAFELYETFVDPKAEDRYRWTWCGRYAIPFGLFLLETLAGKVRAWSLSYETSISAPPLAIDMPPLGFTASASYDHFVGYPAVAFTFASTPKT
jgi:AmmeMemoRadiSam system protein B